MSNAFNKMQRSELIKKGKQCLKEARIQAHNGDFKKRAASEAVEILATGKVSIFELGSFRGEAEGLKLMEDAHFSSNHDEARPRLRLASS